MPLIITELDSATELAGTVFGAAFGHPIPQFPRHFVAFHRAADGERNGTLAAVIGTPGIVHEGSNRWLLPRYVCGADWRSPEELARMLTGET